MANILSMVRNARSWSIAAAEALAAGRRFHMIHKD